MRLITTNTKMFENVSVECDQMLAIINDKALQNPYSGDIYFYVYITKFIVDY